MPKIKPHIEFFSLSNRGPPAHLYSTSHSWYLLSYVFTVFVVLISHCCVFEIYLVPWTVPLYCYVSQHGPGKTRITSNVYKLFKGITDNILYFRVYIYCPEGLGYEHYYYQVSKLLTVKKKNIVNKRYS